MPTVSGQGVVAIDANVNKMKPRITQTNTQSHSDSHSDSDPQSDSLRLFREQEKHKQSMNQIESDSVRLSQTV